MTMQAENCSANNGPQEEKQVTLEGEERRGRQRRKAVMAGLALLIAAAFYGVPKAWYGWTHVSTDDAFVDGTLVPVASEVAGRITALRVDEHQAVRAGDPLMELEASDYSVSVAQKEAALLKSRSEKEELVFQKASAE